MNGIPLTRLNLTKQQFSDENGKQQAAGRILLWADAFGSAADTRYTAIWGPNPSKQAWSCDAVDEGSEALQARFAALRATWCRPAHVSVMPAGQGARALRRLDGRPWFSQVAMTSAGYQAEFEKQAKKGLLPIRLSAQGSGSNTRFAAIFASREETDKRVFRTKGPLTVAAIDSAIETYVKAHNLRGVALAIVRGTKLVYAKGYTYAEPAPTYPDVLPTTVFRQASVSKTFSAVALWRLMQQNPGVKLSTRMQSARRRSLRASRGGWPAGARRRRLGAGGDVAAGGALAPARRAARRLRVRPHPFSGAGCARSST